MRNYQVTLTGKTPLLMHHDNIDWSDTMDEWKSNPDNKSSSKAGDDRTPSWRWLGCCYHDGEVLSIPQGNIMRCLMEGGAMVPVPGGKMGKTFKSQTQSGMMCAEQFWPLHVGAKTISWANVNKLMSEPKFTNHKSAVSNMGFELFVKRAKVGSSKHVRVRPKFGAGWQVSGTLTVWDEQIDLRALTRIVEFSGQYKGLGDWRPGGRTPGPYGTFEGSVKDI